MPIKFRCQHCRQFLGISRSKAGAVVDCPTCGRAVRVPSLDGTVAPLPDPGMDPMDSGLSQALDELAQIAERGWAGGTGGSGGAERAARERSAALATQEEGAPVELPPRAQPIPVEPPPAARPIAAPAGLKIKPLPARRSAPPVEPREADSDDAVRPLVERGGRPEAGAVRAGGPEQAVASAVDAPGKSPAWPLLRRLSPRTRLIGLTCGLAAVALATGFLLGRTGRNDHPAPENAAARPAASKATPAAVADALAGRVTFESDRGTFAPDAGARVIALPAGSPPAAKLSAELLLDETRRQDATDRLARLGVGFAVAGEDGAFALALPNAGSYRVLVVSARQPAEVGLSPPADGEALLQDWLDQPALVSGRRTFLVRDVNYAGRGGVPLDCVFERR